MYNFFPSELCILSYNINFNKVTQMYLNEHDFSWIFTVYEDDIYGGRWVGGGEGS